MHIPNIVSIGTQPSMSDPLRMGYNSKSTFAWVIETYNRHVKTAFQPRQPKV